MIFRMFLMSKISGGGGGEMFKILENWENIFLGGY